MEPSDLRGLHVGVLASLFHLAIQVFNCHSLAIKSGHFTNNKWARGLNI